MKSQNQRVLEYLQNNGEITQLDALIELGCMRLASRINDLRSTGNNIITKMIDVTTRSGAIAKVASYSLTNNSGENE